MQTETSSNVSYNAMMVTPNFPVHPEQDAVELLLTRLQMVSTDEEDVQELIQWVEAASQHLSPDELREPNIRLHYFFQHSSSLVELAHRLSDRIKSRAQHYGPDRLEYLAQCLIAVRLIVRYRDQANQRKSATPEIDKVATLRNWSTTADVNRDLGEIEDRLVALGGAALIDNPTAQAAFLEDQDNGSFQDQFDDVRRRVDMARQSPNEFDAVGITEGELEMIDKILQDADIFYRGREARSIFSKQLTELRDKAFTLAYLEMQKLQMVLRAVTYGDKTIADHIGGKFWQRLNKLSRKRRNRVANPNEAQADESEINSETEEAFSNDVASPAPSTNAVVESEEETPNN